MLLHDPLARKGLAGGRAAVLTGRAVQAPPIEAGSVGAGSEALVIGAPGEAEGKSSNEAAARQPASGQRSEALLLCSLSPLI